jgi:predicted metalloprotease with PDZ domain
MMKKFGLLVLVIILTACTAAQPELSPTLRAPTDTPVPPTVTLTPSVEPTVTSTLKATSTATPTNSPTPDLSSLGVPSEPIPYTGGYPPNHFVFNDNDYNVFQRMIHGRLVTIAWEKELDASESLLDDISDIHFEAFIKWWDIFGGFPYEGYTVVYYTNPDYPNIGAKGIGFEDSGVHLIENQTRNFDPNFLHNRGFISHEIFHAWNHATIQKDSVEELWIIEGVTTYYGDRFTSETAYTNWMKEHWGFYNSEIKDTECDLALIELGKNYQKQSNSCRYYYYVYQKGALVAYMIDQELIELNLSLDDLMKYLYLNYGLTQKKVTSQNVMEALNKISNQDWTEFFGKYIYGTEPLPLSGSFDYLEH